jgi:hypothetical protein
LRKAAPPPATPPCIPAAPALIVVGAGCWVLCFAVLCCAVLCCVLLCCAVLWMSKESALEMLRILCSNYFPKPLAHQPHPRPPPAAMDMQNLTADDLFQERLRIFQEFLDLDVSGSFG